MASSKLLMRALSVAFFSACCNAQSQAENYLQIHGGMTQATGETAVLGDTDFIETLGRQQIDPEGGYGIVAGGALGSEIASFLAVEGEMTVRKEYLQATNLRDAGGRPGDLLTSFAFMLNGMIRPDLRLVPDPYIGIGFGYLQTNIDAGGEAFPDGRLAYQLKAGLSYPLPKKLGDIGLEATYLVSEPFVLENIIPADGAGDNPALGEEFQYGAISAQFTYRRSFGRWLKRERPINRRSGTGRSRNGPKSPGQGAAARR